MGFRGDFEGKRVHFVFDIYDKLSGVLTRVRSPPKPQHAMPKLPESVGVSRGGAIAAPCKQTTLPSFHRPA
jgi:hypothetical protein